jgi:UDP-N-acetylmuramoyl-L-alanyl-D-glutamate--2,6-diaminopimelate ligase
MKTRSYIAEMEVGVGAQNIKNIEYNRQKTSHKDCGSIGSANDIILIAGKGHETYQEINGVRHHLMIWKQ